MNYNKIKESIEYGIKNIKKEHYKNYFYNAYDKNKLKAKTENLNNRLHKNQKNIKINFYVSFKIDLAVKLKYLIL